MRQGKAQVHLHATPHLALARAYNSAANLAGETEVSQGLSSCLHLRSLLVGAIEAPDGAPHSEARAHASDPRVVIPPHESSTGWLRSEGTPRP
jgi:hypothetical protein